MVLCFVKEDEIFDFISDIQQLKKVKRYGSYDKAFMDSVAEHSYAALVLGLRLTEEYKLDLNFEKVVKLFLFHDLGELGLAFDFDAYAVSKNEKLKDEKSEYEQATVAKFANKHNAHDIGKIVQDYKERTSPEARFAYAVDKLENTVHILNTKGVKLQKREHCIAYCEKAAAVFPELWPFAEMLKKKLNIRFDNEEKC